MNNPLQCLNERGLVVYAISLLGWAKTPSTILDAPSGCFLGRLQTLSRQVFIDFATVGPKPHQRILRNFGFFLASFCYGWAKTLPPIPPPEYHLLLWQSYGWAKTPPTFPPKLLFLPGKSLPRLGSTPTNLLPFP